MPEAGLSVPRGQARRRENRSESVAEARSAPERTTPTPATDGATPRPATDRTTARSAPERTTRTPATRSGYGPRPASRDAGRSTDPDPARRAYGGTARSTSRDAAPPRPREASRPGPREAARREAARREAAGRERPGVSLGRPRQPTRLPDRTPSPPAGAAIPGRRTVRIQGRGSERYSPSRDRRRPHRKRHERDGFKPDRTAMWAVLLGVVLILVAATSSHAAVVSRAAASAHSRVALHAREHARVRVVSPRTNRSRP